METCFPRATLRAQQQHLPVARLRLILLPWEGASVAPGAAGCRARRGSAPRSLQARADRHPMKAWLPGLVSQEPTNRRQMMSFVLVLVLPVPANHHLMWKLPPDSQRLRPMVNSPAQDWMILLPFHPIFPTWLQAYWPHPARMWSGQPPPETNSSSSRPKPRYAVVRAWPAHDQAIFRDSGQLENS